MGDSSADDQPAARESADGSDDERRASGESADGPDAIGESDEGQPPSEESGDDRPSPGEFIEEALFETHHLANLTGLDEAELARRRLVNAQSASRRTKTRDLLADACEYLELAGLERRDAAAGFAKARRYARNAAVALRHESPVAVEKSIAELLDAESPRDRRSLAELRSEATVQSYDRLRREIALELAFAEIRSQATDGVIDDPHAVEGDDGTTGADGREATAGNVEEALRMASLEVDIRRALQNGRQARGESEFQFLSRDQLVSGDRPAETTGRR